MGSPGLRSDSCSKQSAGTPPRSIAGKSYRTFVDNSSKTRRHRDGRSDTHGSSVGTEKEREIERRTSRDRKCVPRAFVLTSAQCYRLQRRSDQSRAEAPGLRSDSYSRELAATSP
eukprot:9058610-Pyramimonas_sp.AAC.1